MSAPKRKNMRILIIEDEPSLAEVIAQHLKREHFQTDIVHCGQEGYYMAKEPIYDLIILDILLPKMDGLTILKKLRTENISTTILMLTAKSELEDKVKGLNAGADDYLAKPFATEELIARVKALTRRNDQTLFNDKMKFGDLTLQTNKLLLCNDSHEVVLTGKAKKVCCNHSQQFRKQNFRTGLALYF